MLYHISDNVRPNCLNAILPDYQKINALPKTQKMVLTTNETATLAFVTRGYAGQGYKIDWGDGTFEYINNAGVGSNNSLSHDYDGLAGTKAVTLTGDLLALTRFVANSQKLTNDIKVFSVLKNLTYLDCSNNKNTGNLNDAVCNMSNLTTLSVYQTGNTTSNPVNWVACTLPTTWTGTYTIFKEKWTSSEVDQILADFNAMGTSNGTLTCGGGGPWIDAARTAASDTDKTALLSRGWSITVNE